VQGRKNAIPPLIIGLPDSQSESGLHVALVMKYSLEGQTREQMRGAGKPAILS
jgi:hypothetical protein